MAGGMNKQPIFYIYSWPLPLELPFIENLLSGQIIWIES